jgi:hypothetical protein
MNTTFERTSKRLAGVTGLAFTLALLAAATAGARPLMPDGEPMPGTAGPTTTSGGIDPATVAEGTADGTGWIAVAAVSLTVLALTFVVVLIGRSRRPLAVH